MAKPKTMAHRKIIFAKPGFPVLIWALDPRGNLVSWRFGDLSDLSANARGSNLNPEKEATENSSTMSESEEPHLEDIFLWDDTYFPDDPESDQFGLNWP
jgi:hypothetical protein